jgi:hypothetical protein
MAQGADFRSRITIDGADAAVADFKKVGTEGEKAFNATAAAADTASRSITGVSRAADVAARSMAAMASSMRAQAGQIGQGFSELHQHATNFGNSLSNVANNIIPRWREVMALGAAGVGAGFLALFESTAKWGHELEQNARILGTTPGELKLIGQAAAAAGIDIETLVTGMARFGKSMEAAAEQRKKTFGDLAKDVLGADSAINQLGVTILRGGRGTAPDPLDAKRMIDVPRMEQFRDVAAQAYATFPAAVKASMTLDQWLAKVSQKLMAGGEGAAKIREDLNKAGANLPAKRLGEAIDQAMPGFKDLFAELNVPLFDKTTGAVRNITDAFGDFLDAFAKQAPAKQIKLVTDTLGRGFLDLIPIMQKGRAGLFEFVDEAKAMGKDTSALDKEIESLSEAYRSIRRLDAAIGGLRKSFVVPFADVFTPLIKEWVSWLETSKGAVKTWATEVAAQARAVSQDLVGILHGAQPTTEFGQVVVLGLNAIRIAVDAVKLAFQGLMLIIEPFTGLLNAALGTNYTTQTYALAAAFLYFSGILPAAATGIRLVWAALQLIYATPFGLALAAIAGAALLIYQNWDTLGPMFQKLWDLLKSFGAWLSDQWTKFWTDPIQGIKDQWNAVFDWLSAKADQVWQKLKSLNPFAGASMPPVGSPSLAPFAAGGQVPGRGSGDIVPALLTPGEFVIRKGIVDQLGAGFFSALNGGMGSLIPRGRYATGGLVMEGAGAGGTPVHLHLDGQSYSMRADSDVAESLLRAARAKQMLSAGRKPGWAGGRRYGG